MKNKYPGDRTVDIQQARAAASRYKERGVTESAAAMGGFEAVIEDAPEDNRKKYLKETLTQERAKATVAEAESRGAPRSAAETLASLAQERIIGSNDMRDINFLEVAVAIARAVCRIRIGAGAGSGVLVGPRLLMTNNHVLHSPDDAALEPDDDQGRDQQVDEDQDGLDQREPERRVAEVRGGVLRRRQRSDEAVCR